MSDDDQLVARLRQGDTEALARFVQARRGGLLAYIDRQLSSAMKRKVEPEDLFQEVSAEAVRALAGVDLSERDPFGWLCQIAQRRIIDAHRRLFGAQKRDAAREVSLGMPGPSSSRASLVDLLVASMTTPSQAFTRNQREARLVEALATLPSDQQEALRLRYVEGLPSKDIAERLRKSDGAVRVMLTRSLARLQRLLGDDPDA
jgi:RNA polymerase sigma-70 factor (ECF subfamily)